VACFFPDTVYMTRITVTCVWLISNCLSCARSVVSSLSSSETMYHFSKCARALPPWHCLPFLPAEMGDMHVHFIPQHPDLNPVNYTICSQMQQEVYLRKIYNMNKPTLCHGWHGFDHNATYEWCKRLRVYVYVKRRLSEYLLWLQTIHLYILMC